MKKICSIFAISAVLFAGAALADDNAVYSANAVGVIKYTIPANGVLACISLPMNTMDDEQSGVNGGWYWPQTDIAKQLPGGSMVYFWNKRTLGWSSSQKNLRTGNWSTPSTEDDLFDLAPGEAFFVRTPADTATETVVSLLGELPTDETLPIVVTGSNHLDLLGATMYPVSVTFTNTTLAKTLPGGSSVYFWNGSQWLYREKRVRDSKWTTTSDGREVLGIGEGIFVKKADESVTINDERIFDW